MGSLAGSRARDDRSAARTALVRDAAPSDAPAVAAIGVVAVPRTYEEIISDPFVMQAIVEQSYAPDALRDCIARCARAEDAYFLVAERDGRLVGFLHYDCEGPEPELHRVYVDPRHLRERIGSALLEELHRRLPAGASYILMVVEANRPAVAFYEQHGFIEADRVDGVAYMHDHMGVEFAPGTPQVPALILRFTKPATPQPKGGDSMLQYMVERDLPGFPPEQLPSAASAGRKNRPR